MRPSESKWQPSTEVVKSKSCCDRIFYLEKVDAWTPLKQLKSVAQKLKLSKNCSNQKMVSSRSMKNVSLKINSVRNKKGFNLDQVKKIFSDAKNSKSNQQKKIQISANPYISINTLQTSLASLRVYQQRQNLENLYSSRKYSTINSYRNNFQDSSVSLRITSKNNENDFCSNEQYKDNGISQKADMKFLSSTRITTINSSAFASKNSFFKEEIRINQEQSDSGSIQMSTLLSVSITVPKSNQIIQEQQKIIQQNKHSVLQTHLFPNKRLSCFSRGQIKLVSARQVQTIQSIKTEQSLISEVQHETKQSGSNIFHRILVLKRHNNEHLG